MLDASSVHDHERPDRAVHRRVEGVAEHEPHDDPDEDLAADGRDGDGVHDHGGDERRQCGHGELGEPEQPDAGDLAGEQGAGGHAGQQDLDDPAGLLLHHTGEHQFPVIGGQGDQQQADMIMAAVASPECARQRCQAAGSRPVPGPRPPQLAGSIPAAVARCWTATSWMAAVTTSAVARPACPATPAVGRPRRGRRRPGRGRLLRRPARRLVPVRTVASRASPWSTTAAGSAAGWRG